MSSCALKPDFSSAQHNSNGGPLCSVCAAAPFGLMPNDLKRHRLHVPDHMCTSEKHDWIRKFTKGYLPPTGLVSALPRPQCCWSCPLQVQGRLQDII